MIKGIFSIKVFPKNVDGGKFLVKQCVIPFLEMRDDLIYPLSNIILREVNKLDLTINWDQHISLLFHIRSCLNISKKLHGWFNIKLILFNIEFSDIYGYLLLGWGQIFLFFICFLFHCSEESIRNCNIFLFWVTDPSLLYFLRLTKHIWI